MRSNSLSQRQPSGPADPSDLISRLLAGDEALFGSLVERWHPGLLRVARAITGNTSIAEEVVQKTWASVLRSLHAFEARSSFRTSVHRRCTQVALALVPRDDSSSAPGDPVVDPARFDDQGHWRAPPGWWSVRAPETPDARPEVMDRVQRAVDSLPMQQRLVVILRDVEGFTADEASEILGVSEVHQRVLLHRARSRVRAEFEEDVVPLSSCPGGSARIVAATCGGRARSAVRSPWIDDDPGLRPATR